jgi:O-antigen ligase
MMQSGSKNNWQEWWICILLVFLLIGLLVSRALVSFASVLMVAPFFFNAREVKAIYPVASALLLFPVLVSGFWSDDKMLWWNSVSVKLPLFTLMLGLCSVTLSAMRWKQLVFIFLLIVLAGCCWSVSQYSFKIQEAYLKAKTLPTPMDNDHIRFSWLVAVAVLLGLHCLLAEKNKLAKACLTAVVLLLVAYLHILAAKTGLACLYLGCFLYFLYAVFIRKKWKTGIGMAVVVFAMALACYKTMPTLRNRIQYIVYDFQNYSKGNPMPGYNDAARWLSIRAGYDIMHMHPLTGVGAGDVLNEVNKWHQANHPESLAYERFLPANEWLVYGASSGWPGFLFFTAGLVLLLYATTSKNALSFVLSATALIPFLVDDTFEGQYGVVILAFIAFFGQQKLTGSNI